MSKVILAMDKPSSCYDCAFSVNVQLTLLVNADGSPKLYKDTAIPYGEYEIKEINNSLGDD